VADGGGEGVGIYNSTSTVTLLRVTASGNDYGMSNNTSSTAKVAFSSLAGTTGAISGTGTTCSFTIDGTTFAALVCT
jgi:hypothetical protein